VGGGKEEEEEDMAVDGVEEDGSHDHERIDAVLSVAAYLGLPPPPC
jgi:hypothetical protein